MKRWDGSVVVVFLAVVVAMVLAGPGEGREVAPGRYLGQTPPGLTPEVFAPGVVSLPGRYEYCLVFSPDLDECVFGLTNSGWSGFNLQYMKMGSDSVWTDPVAAPFQGTGDGLYPFFSADGDDVYFVSSRPNYSPTRLWTSAREGAGWSVPAPLEAPVYSGANEWGGSLTEDGTLYFCSDRADGLGAGDIYRAVTLPGGEVIVENLGVPFNSPQLEGAPCVARDGSHVIFESRRPGGFGQSDLYISYQENGAWSVPRNLGPAINTSQIEDGPFLSPDGKYLFFNRRRAPYTTEQTDIWWVDARVVFDPGVSDATVPEEVMGERIVLRSAPNPCRGATTITYATPASGFVTIQVYDLLGREVQSLVNAPVPAGVHSIDLDLRRDDARAEGIYFCRLDLDGGPPRTVKIVSVR